MTKLRYYLWYFFCWLVAASLYLVIVWVTLALGVPVAWSYAREAPSVLWLVVYVVLAVLYVGCVGRLPPVVRRWLQDLLLGVPRAPHRKGGATSLLALLVFAKKASRALLAWVQPVAVVAVRSPIFEVPTAVVPPSSADASQPEPLVGGETAERAGGEVGAVIEIETFHAMPLLAEVDLRGEVAVGLTERRCHDVAHAWANGLCDIVVILDPRLHNSAAAVAMARGRLHKHGVPDDAIYVHPAPMNLRRGGRAKLITKLSAAYGRPVTYESTRS
jgi:hypothetical protein